LQYILFVVSANVHLIQCVISNQMVANEIGCLLSAYTGMYILY